MSKFRLAALTLCVTALAQQPVFRSETELVLVDTLVTSKKGEFVRDLTAQDFRIREDNKERPIRSFSLESAENHKEPRRFVFFFDNSNSAVSDQAASVRAATAFIDASAGPESLVAAVTYDGQFRMVQPFTDNPARVKQSLAGIRFNAADPSAQGTQAVVRSQTAVTGSADIRGLVQSLESLARNLNALPGRKALVLFTSGTFLNPEQNMNLKELEALCNKANVAVYPILVVSAQSPAVGQLDCDQRLPRGRMAPQQTACAAADNTGVSDALAKATGGFIVRTTGDLSSELNLIGSEETEHYVIGFEPLSANSKDGCHELKVTVDRPGVSVRARSGYCANKPQDILEGSKSARELEKHATDSSNAQLLSVEAPFFYQAPNVARVHAAVRIPAGSLKFETAKGRLHLELNLLGIASAADGSVAARFSDIVKRDFDARPESLDYEKEFRIAPGQYSLTITFNSGGADFGKATTPLAIEPFDGSHPAISAIVLGNAVRPAENIGIEALSGDGTPLIAGGMQIVQSASRLMNREKPAFCYFEVYGPHTADGATVRVRLVSAASGKDAWDGGEGKVTAIRPASGVIAVGLALPIAGLQPGTYRIEATARDNSGTVATRSREIEIR